MLAVFTLSACGRMGRPVTPTRPSDDTAFPPPLEIVQPGLDKDPTLPLTVDPGDVLTLRLVSTETSEVQGLIVDDRGMINVPLAGDVDVGGMPIAAAAKAIEQALRRYNRVIQVSLILQTPAGHMASVLGAVVNPGRVPVMPGTRVADLFAAVGGPVYSESDNGLREQMADLDGARLIRNGHALPISIPKAIEGDPRHNVHARPGDQLYVPQQVHNIMVLGQVKTPRPVMFRPGIRLTEALARAGGLDVGGDRKDIRVVRGPLSAPRVYVTSLAKLVNGHATDVELARGDIVYVTEQWTASTGEVLSRLSPILSIGTNAAGTAIGIGIANSISNKK